MPMSALPLGMRPSYTSLAVELQFTSVQHRPRKSTHDGDLHWWTPVDERKRRAADSLVPSLRDSHPWRPPHQG
jgi:hypothetical protein